MLSSCARLISNSSGQAVAKAPVNRSSKISSSFTTPTPSNKTVSTSKRFYAGHGHHEEPVKPYKRTILSAKPTDASKTDEERQREVAGIEGWLFGRKVTYVDPLKPIPNTEAQQNANGWMWNSKPNADGSLPKPEEWEPVTYIGTLIFTIVVVFGLWSRPDTTIQNWAIEEARERKIIKGRRSLEQAQQESL